MEEREIVKEPLVIPDGFFDVPGDWPLPESRSEAELKEKAEALEAFNAAWDKRMDGEDVDIPQLPHWMRGHDPSEWRYVSEAIPSVWVSNAGGACPFQAEGTIAGLPFYLRSRGGSASLEVYADEEGLDKHTPIYSAHMEVDEFDYDLLVYMRQLVYRLEKAPFLYEFNSWAGEFVGGSKTGKFNVVPTGALDVQFAWGDSAEEAYERTQSVDRVTSRHFSEEVQRLIISYRQTNPEPLNTDTRVFPTEEPWFITNKRRNATDG